MNNLLNVVWCNLRNVNSLKFYELPHFINVQSLCYRDIVLNNLLNVVWCNQHDATYNNPIKSAKCKLVVQLGSFFLYSCALFSQFPKPVIHQRFKKVSIISLCSILIITYQRRSSCLLISVNMRIWFCLFVLRFYGPVNPMESCRARSVYLTTRLLGKLSPLSG